MDENGPDIKLLPPPEQSSDQFPIGRNRFFSLPDLFQRLLLPFQLTPQEKRMALVSMLTATTVGLYIFQS